MTETKRGGLALHWLMLIGFTVGLGAGLWVNLTLAPTRLGRLADRQRHRPGRSDLPAPAVHDGDPLAVLGLVIGVAEMGDLNALGRAGIRTLLLTILVSGIAWS